MDPFVTQGLSHEHQHSKLLQESRARRFSHRDTSLQLLKLRVQTTWHLSLSFRKNNLASRLLLIHRVCMYVRAHAEEAVLMKIICVFCEFYNFHLLVLLYTDIRMYMYFLTPYYVAWN